MIAAAMTISRSAVAPYRAADGTVLVEMAISERLPALMTWRQALQLGIAMLIVANRVAAAQVTRTGRATG